MGYYASKSSRATTARRPALRRRDTPFGFGVFASPAPPPSAPTKPAVPPVSYPEKPRPRPRPSRSRVVDPPLTTWDAEAGCYRLDLFAADLDAYQSMVQADADREADEALDAHYRGLYEAHMAEEAAKDEARQYFGVTC